MIHIVGMAKSCLDLRGGKGRNLELDFRHLVAAIRDIESLGYQARGFLLVLDEKVRRRADGWRKKYGVTDRVEVILATLTAEELAQIHKEKFRNKLGNKPDGDPNDAAAKVSQSISETHLENEIRIRHPSARNRAPEILSLKTVAWDFYGQTRIGED